MNSLYLEFFKLKRKKVFIFMFFLISFECAFGLYQIHRDLTYDIKGFEMEYLIMELTDLNAIFFPILIAVIISRLCEIEHKDNFWKNLFCVGISKKSIYLNKFIISCILILLCIIGEFITILIYSLFTKIKFSLILLIIFSLCTFMVSIPIIALQLFISSFYKNQTYAITLGISGSFIGFTAGLFPDVIRRILIWSYYWDLSPVSFVFKENKIMGISYQGISIIPVIIIFIIGILIYILGKRIFCKKEI